MAKAVNERSAAAEALCVEYDILEALMAGTRAMRAGGVKFLPKFPNEEQDAYAARLALATLFPAYRRTVSVMAGKPFAKQLTLSKETPEQIVDWADDVDREGVNLHTFAAEMFQESFYGLAGILVDAPRAPDTGGRPITQAEEKRAGIRPYFVRVKHRQILGWRTELRDGARRLTQLRIQENSTVPDGPFGEKEVERVRVLEPGKWAVWQKDEQPAAGGQESWSVREEGDTGLAYIPFVPLYGQRRGFMDGACPLLDLAYLNVKHWQSQSDQDTILHVARVPILAVIGGDQDKVSLTVGASSAVFLPDGADMKFVEHTGAAIEAGAKSLADLEQQMIQAGAELLVKKPGDRSATEAANDAEANKSDLQRMVEGFEDALDAALQMMADFAKLPSGGSVSLFKDFSAATLAAASAALITSWKDAGLITARTAIQELQRRGELSPDLDPEEEIEAVAKEGPDPSDEDERAALTLPAEDA